MKMGLLHPPTGNNIRRKRHFCYLIFVLNSITSKSQYAVFAVLIPTINIVNLIGQGPLFEMFDDVYQTQSRLCQEIFTLHRKVLCINSSPDKTLLFEFFEPLGEHFRSNSGKRLF